VVIDTSALIAIVRNEAGFQALVERILEASMPKISVLSALEAKLVLSRDVKDQLLFSQLLSELSINAVPVNEKVAALAFDAFMRYGKGRHPAGLNICDCVSYATAQAYQEPLLYVGNDFRRTDVIAAI
jgi:ribonuclease VapC